MAVCVSRGAGCALHRVTCSGFSRKSRGGERKRGEKEGRHACTGFVHRWNDAVAHKVREPCTPVRYQWSFTATHTAAVFAGCAEGERGASRCCVLCARQDRDTTLRYHGLGTARQRIPARVPLHVRSSFPLLRADRACALGRHLHFGCTPVRFRLCRSLSPFASLVDMVALVAPLRTQIARTACNVNFAQIKRPLRRRKQPWGRRRRRRRRRQARGNGAGDG